MYCMYVLMYVYYLVLCTYGCRQRKEEGGERERDRETFECVCVCLRVFVCLCVSVSVSVSVSVFVRERADQYTTHTSLVASPHGAASPTPSIRRKLLGGEGRRLQGSLRGNVDVGGGGGGGRGGDGDGGDARNGIPWMRTRDGDANVSP